VYKETSSIAESRYFHSPSNIQLLTLVQINRHSLAHLLRCFCLQDRFHPSFHPLVLRHFVDRRTIHSGLFNPHSQNEDCYRRHRSERPRCASSGLARPHRARSDVQRHAHGARQPEADRTAGPSDGRHLP